MLNGNREEFLKLGSGHRLRNIFFYACVLIAYFQFVGPVPGIDLQPIFFLFALAGLLIFMADATVPLGTVMVLSVSAVLIISRVLIFDDNVDLRYISIYLFALLAIFFFFCLFSITRIGISSRLLEAVFFIYAFVGLVQFAQPDFLSWTVHRSELAAFSYAETGRGVRSLTGEPAALGKVFSTINVLYVLAILTQGGRGRKTRILIFSAISLAATVFISRSAYAIGIHSILFSLLFFLINRRGFYIACVVIFSVGAVILPLILGFLEKVEGVRAVNIFMGLLNNPDVVLAQGAIRRVLNIPISLNGLYMYGLAGSGNSSQVFQSSVWTPLGMLNYEAHSRAMGGFIEFLFRFGLFSVPLIIFYLFIGLRVAFVQVLVGGGRCRIGLYFSAAILLLSMQDSSPALPMSLLMVVALYSFRQRLVSS